MTELFLDWFPVLMVLLGGGVWVALRQLFTTDVQSGFDSDRPPGGGWQSAFDNPVDSLSIVFLFILVSSFLFFAIPFFTYYQPTVDPPPEVFPTIAYFTVICLSGLFYAVGEGLTNWK